MRTSSCRSCSSSRITRLTAHKSIPPVRTCTLSQSATVIWRVLLSTFLLFRQLHLFGSYFRSEASTGLLSISYVHTNLPYCNYVGKCRFWSSNCTFWCLFGLTECATNYTRPNHCSPKTHKISIYLQVFNIVSLLCNSPLRQSQPIRS